jgi:hypothetical protein
MRNPLYDKDFLKELDNQKEREIYTKIIALDLNENPVEEVSGRVTQGSVSIDGTSAVRRTCSLSMVAQEMNIHEYYWGMNTKFKLAVGMKNKINSEYPDIIWFPQGVYLITSFSTSQGTSSYTISISGKDKMCLLNGDIGGSIYSLTYDFGTMDYITAEGDTVNESIEIKDIIREVVHEFAQEPYHNIVINDLEDCGVELLEYRGSTDMFLIVNQNTSEVTGMSFNENQGGYYGYINGVLYKNITLGNIEELQGSYDHRISLDTTINNPTYIYVNQDSTRTPYSVIRVTYGDVVGYRETSLTYAGDLIGNVGESLTSSCLDKIVSMLGDFEYFYDIDGRFIFQRKKTYSNVSWNNIITTNDETYVENSAYLSADDYSFDDSNLITSFSNSPNLANLKNDFSIWGTRTSVSGSELPVHLRYAIDKKPYIYKTLGGHIYMTQEYYENMDNLGSSGSSTITKETFRTHVMPEGLNDDWWEIEDWAKYYEYLTGELPDKTLSNYWTEYTKIDLTKYFGTGAGLGWDADRPLFLFDVNSDNDLAYTAHNPSKYVDVTTNHMSCYHTYKQLLNSKYQQGWTSYIYKPKLPESEITDEVKDKLANMEATICDWREIIYQMAVDYMQHHKEDDFISNIANNNPNFYSSGYTGYEIYYTDLYSFWRDLYNPDYTYTYSISGCYKSAYESNPSDYYWYVQCTEDDEYNSKNQYYSLTLYGTYTVRKISEETFNKNKTSFYYLKQGSSSDAFDLDRIYYYKVEDEFDKESYWSKTVKESPESLNFWFDFLDNDGGDLSQYSVHNVGDRPKSVNDSDVKAIYFRDTPTVIFLDPAQIEDDIREAWEVEMAKDNTLGPLTEEEIQEKIQEEIDKQKDLKPGYTFFKLQSYLENLFTISSQGKSAQDALDDFIYQYSYCTETITINALPVYYLQPNTRIFIRDDNSGINGEYIITRISLPLNYNGTMSITATKAVDRIY